MSNLMFENLETTIDIILAIGGLLVTILSIVGGP